MEVSIKELREIGESLPISYYCGRKIETRIVEDMPTSFYDTKNDVITLSLVPIKQAIASLEETATAEDKEILVRSTFYHELSHAMLTPTMQVTDKLNIFEDERIERKCDSYYMGVDFKKNILAMNGFKDLADVMAIAPTTSTQVFYQAVRFGIASEENLKKIKEVLKEYDYINSTSSKQNSDNYKKVIDNLYNEITKDFAEDKAEEFQENILKELAEKLAEKKNGSGATPLTKEELAKELQKAYDNNISPIDDYDKAERKKEKADNKSEKGGNSGDENSDNAEENENEEIGNSEGNSTLAKGRGKILSGKDVFKDIADRFNGNNVNTLLEHFDNIISQFNKRNSGGSAVNGYSGRVNPRLVGRSDYRIFERKSCVQGNNMYGSLHLNLFIDVSGSFYRNEDTVNNILKALTILEDKYNFFEFDLITCGQVETLKDKKDRQINCTGGNNITKNLPILFKKVQKANTLTYNIALFDGDCLSDCPHCDRKEHKKYFHSFDRDNVTLITECDNLRYCKDFVHTKPIVEDYDYCSKLIENISKAMQKAFR